MPILLSASASARLSKTGTGSPEGAVTAKVGTVYIQSDASPDQEAVWYKQTGTGNTGWVQIIPDVGLSDGDKGDITVSASGATWTIDNGVVSGAKATNNLRDVAVPFIIDGGGSVIATGLAGGFEVPFSGTIVAARVGALDGNTGSIVLDLWKDTYANFPPTVADTITASAKPTISSATKAEDTTLTGWTTSVTAGDWIFVNVDSVDVFIKAILSLTIRRS